IFFSSLETSNLPAFSIAPSMSLIGRHTRDKPLWSIRPNAELFERQAEIAASKRPDITLLFTCDIKPVSDFVALRIVIYLSKKITNARNKRKVIGIIIHPPFISI